MVSDEQWGVRRLVLDRDGGDLEWRFEEMGKDSKRFWDLVKFWCVVKWTMFFCLFV